MKKILPNVLAYCLIVLFCFSAYPSGAKNSPPASTAELIVQTPQCTAKNYASVKQALLNAGGVQLMGYCENTHMFYLLVDRSVQVDDTFLDTIFKPLTWDYYVKSGATIAAAMAQCGQITDQYIPAILNSNPSNH